MTTSLDADGMRKIVVQHAACELARDWKGALATMTATPVYEYYPFRYRISGPAAITETWERLLPLPCFDAANVTLHSHEEYVGSDSLVHVSEWTFRDERGEPHRTKVVVKYTFEGDRMASESVFMDASMMALVDPVLDDGFRSMPGVEFVS